MAPLFNLEKLSNYVDDNYIVGWNSITESLIIDVRKFLEAITKWLKDSGLKDSGLRVSLNNFTLKSNINTIV